MWSKLFDEDFSLAEEMIEDVASEFYDLGIIIDGKIGNTDKGVVYELGDVLACIIRDYLRLYNKINLQANYPTVYKKALYPHHENLGEDWMVETNGTEEELDKWTDMVEQTAKAFERMADGYESGQEQVDEAFDMLKKIFLVYVLKWGERIFMCLKPEVNYKELFAEFEEQEKHI